MRVELDGINVYINSKHVVRYIPREPLFNQVKVALNKDELAEFIEFIRSSYNGDALTDEELAENISDKEIEAWEKRVYLERKSSVYRKYLRISYHKDEVRFYGVSNKNKVIFLASNKEEYVKAIINYLQVNQETIEFCKRNGITHTLAKSDRAIRDDIKQCLLYGLIDVVEYKLISNKPGELCEFYFPLDIVRPEKDTPAWDNFTAQMSTEEERECFKAWVYSVFKADNYGRQVLWLLGPGNSGKSAVSRVITNRLESIATSIPKYKDYDKYTMAGLVNKRFICVPDSVDKFLLKEQLIKNLTGRDIVTIREMGSMQKASEIYAKILVTSNMKPIIDTTKQEEISRLLLLTLDGDKCRKHRDMWKVDIHGDWFSQLTIEFDDFVYGCRSAYYSRLAEDGNNIKVPKRMLDEIRASDFMSLDNLHVWYGFRLKKKMGEAISFEDLVKNFFDFYHKRFKFMTRPATIRLREYFDSKKIEWGTKYGIDCLYDHSFVHKDKTISHYAKRKEK